MKLLRNQDRRRIEKIIVKHLESGDKMAKTFEDIKERHTWRCNGDVRRLNNEDIDFLIHLIEEQQKEIEQLKFVMRIYDRYSNWSYAKKYGIEL